MGFVTVYLVVCLNVATRLGCTNLPITNNDQPQANGAEVNMSGCMGLEGFQTAKKYWEDPKQASLREHYQFGGWACTIGNKKLPEKGKA